jgi:hypothetical protein
MPQFILAMATPEVWDDALEAQSQADRRRIAPFPASALRRAGAEDQPRAKCASWAPAVYTSLHRDLSTHWHNLPAAPQQPALGEMLRDVPFFLPLTLVNRIFLADFTACQKCRDATLVLSTYVKKLL